MNRLAKVCARYLGGHRGFSIGIEDVTPGIQVSKLIVPLSLLLLLVMMAPPSSLSTPMFAFTVSAMFWRLLSSVPSVRW